MATLNEAWSVEQGPVAEGYPPNVLQNLKDFFILDDEGRWIYSVLSSDKKKKAGPKLDPGVIKMFLDADPTPDKAWFTWLLHEAAGGTTQQKAREDALGQIRDRFIQERMDGFTHPATGEEIPPMGKEAAEARWATAEPRFRRKLAVLDEDGVTELGVYGFYRSWPGGDTEHRYEHLLAAFKNLMQTMPLLVKANKLLVAEGKEPFPSKPSQYISGSQVSFRSIPYKEVNAIVDKVRRFWAAQRAREDVRYDTVYDDDVLRVIMPLTYSAAVRYGHPEWDIASASKFDQTLAGEGRSWDDPWQQHTRANVHAYLRFKNPVPAWVSQARGGEYKTFYLTNLMIRQPVETLRNANIDEIEVYDEENKSNRTIGQVKEMILAEPTRQDTPEEEQLPVYRGPNVYKTAQEAQDVVAHLDAAMQALKQHAREFDPKAVATNPLDFSNYERRGD